jgi:hypothetical protein
MKKFSTSSQIFITLFFLFVITSISVRAQELAFPGAQGWASTTTGGRNGKIIRVTTLNNEGPGSFREAVSTPGPRIVVFEVGGVIDMKGEMIRIKDPFLTIAGQTAPSPGITLIDGSVNVNTNDVVIRHIRMRLGASRHQTDWEPDAFATIGAYNVIIDHCTFTWGVDENCSASGPRFNGTTPDEWRQNTSHRITMSNNIIAEGLSNSTHSKGEHSKGTLIHDNATEIAIVNNLYSSNKDRNALFKGGSQGIFVNNYIYNPGSNAVRYAQINSEWVGHTPEMGKLTIIGNVLQLGPSSSDMPLAYIGNGPCQTYMEDNIAKTATGADARLTFGEPQKFVTEKPVWYPALKPIKAEEVRQSIIKNVGARPWDRDEHDKRIIEEMISIKGKIIDSEKEVGGYPAHKPTKRRFVEKEWNLTTMEKKPVATQSR